MPTVKLPKNKFFAPQLSAVLLCSALLVLSCISTEDPSSDGDPPLLPPSPWRQEAMQPIDASGLLELQVKSFADPSGRLHTVYYTNSGDSAYPYALEHQIWDVSDGQLQLLSGPDMIIEIDNNQDLGLAVDNSGTPVVAYQGGNVRECGGDDQSDVMINLKNDGQWQESLGAMGFVERNPVLTDGLAGSNLDVAVDAAGDIHICYQFFYEGCDAMNRNYPDVKYAQRPRGELDNQAIVEEQIEGNLYPDFGTGIQNSVGYHCRIVLDSAEAPVVVYAVKTEFDQVYGLRAARRNPADGNWELEWIEEGCDVAAISAARSPVDGSLGVAYAVNEHNGVAAVTFLKFAWYKNGAWQVRMVDDKVSCGRHCSVAFDSAGRPAIAYYETKSHTGYTLQNLKLAEFNGSLWETSQVASYGNIGLYNSLWFDAADRAYICTYSDSQKEILLYRRERK